MRWYLSILYLRAENSGKRENDFQLWYTWGKCVNNTGNILWKNDFYVVMSYLHLGITGLEQQQQQQNPVVLHILISGWSPLELTDIPQAHWTDRWSLSVPFVYFKLHVAWHQELFSMPSSGIWHWCEMLWIAACWYHSNWMAFGKWSHFHITWLRRINLLNGYIPVKSRLSVNCRGAQRASFST